MYRFDVEDAPLRHYYPTKRSSTLVIPDYVCNATPSSRAQQAIVYDDHVIIIVYDQWSGVCAVPSRLCFCFNTTRHTDIKFTRATLS